MGYPYQSYILVYSELAVWAIFEGFLGETSDRSLGTFKFEGINSGAELCCTVII
jgi:hypothetical protein